MNTDEKIRKHYFNKYVKVFENGIVDLHEQLDQLDCDFYQARQFDIAEGIELNKEDLQRYLGIHDAILE